MKLIGLLFGLVIHTITLSQNFTDSNLPIVIITTDGNANIPDAPRILANMKIVYKGPGLRNALADQNDPTALNYNGRIEIEIRGSSSQALEKKQYGLTTLMADNRTNNNVSLLGMPEENDWVLNGLAFDASMIRDYISYSLSRTIGEYAPRTVFCEVMINGNYQGLYMLQEKIKVDDGRVDIVKIEPDDNTQPDISGGYIIKADKVTAEDPSGWAFSSYLGNNDVNFIYEFPKPTAITYQQKDYIKSVFFALAGSASTNNISPVNGFPSVIDIPSFINFMLINELAANVDAYQFSTFFHKDKRGKLRAGPLWDLNLTYSNDLFFWGLDRSKTDRWQFDNGDNVGAKFWKDLFNSQAYRCQMSKRWNALTQDGQPLSPFTINSLIDATVNHISEAVARENARWGTIGNHANHIAGIKNFLAVRMPWMTNSLGSFSGCSTVSTPPLVITKIMYNPSTNTQFNSSSDQEFIEITNTGNEPVDVTGYYFGGTGFVYQFPNNFMLPPQGVIQIANQTEVFNQKYNISAFGQFTRNLSNNSQKLTLSDAWGNTIDEVTYSSAAPWPDASANGFYLKLKSTNLDNNVPENWTRSDATPTTNVTITGIEEIPQIEVLPNPVRQSLSVQSKEEMSSIRISTIQGATLEVAQGSFHSKDFSFTDYPNGVYVIAIQTTNQIIIKRVIKID